MNRKFSSKYTIVFTVIICCMTALILTFANHMLHERIALNERLAKMKSVLKCFGMLDENANSLQITKDFNNNINVTALGVMTLYEPRNKNNTQGYAVELKCRGKYGPIRGIVSFHPDKQKLLNLDIYDHNETPGLGGRISTPEWLVQFKDLPIAQDELFTGVIIDSDEEGPNCVDGITGASKTVFSVSKALNKTIFQFLVDGRDVEILDLELDAVTRATPGWPKNLKMPGNFRGTELRRPPVIVQPSTKLLSREKPVTCSMGKTPILGTLDQIVDGDKRSEEENIVELSPGAQWIQIDLEKTKEISLVVIWHHYKNAAIYNDVVVQLSDDPQFKTNVKTIYNNDHDNSSGMGVGQDTSYAARWWGEIADARGKAFNKKVRARYVRVYTADGAGDEPPRFVEISVYGK
ncbi:FMN-binding protein [Verrucomicrobiota bacterium]